MSTRNDAPVIEGFELHTHTASSIMRNPAEAAQAPGTYRPTSLLALLMDIPQRTSNPQVATVFMLDAIEKFAAAATNLDIEAYNQTEQAAVIPGIVWKQMAFEIDSILQEHLAYVNAQASTPELPTAEQAMQERINAYIERLKAHRASGATELPADLAALKESLDPTGSMFENFGKNATLG